MVGQRLCADSTVLGLQGNLSVALVKPRHAGAVSEAALHIFVTPCSPRMNIMNMDPEHTPEPPC